MEKPPICSYEGSDYQVSFWEEGGREYEHEAEGIALKRLLPDSGKLFLELGAGAGRNTPRYEAFEQIVLVDYSETQLQQARQRMGDSERYRYVIADIYQLPFVPSIFDGATMIRTLHHMVEPRQALGQVHRVLANRASFILEYANKQNLKAILRYALKQQEWSPFTPEPIEFAPLNFDFHPETVRSWLQMSGFAIEKQLTVSHFRIGWLKRTLPLNLLVKMDSLAQLTGNLWQLSPSVFVGARCKKPEASTPPEGIFCCPACGFSPLPESGENIICPDCSRNYPVKDGIYDFRVISNTD
jgi:ubiquinone/menaquinone biosynthesis C-methylase UbiE